ncbi:Cupredoxin [Aspergillus multicolor]|uniref:Cupredoxin n=1 Tax=Aspergillus multicolor TaxID=41759 RepID=UPI003CCD0EDF
MLYTTAAKHIWFATCVTKEAWTVPGALAISIYNIIYNTLNSILFLYAATSAMLPAGKTLANPYLQGGAALFILGIGAEWQCELQRRRFKADPANKGKLFTQGLFALVRHPNYTGYTVWRGGLGLVTGGPLAGMLIAAFFAWDFCHRAIPALDEYCSKRSFVYCFKATPAGTHWWHSHERMLLVDRLYGAIFIKPKGDYTSLWAQISPDPVDIGAMAKAAADSELVVVSDWSQYPSEDCVDSILVNAVGAVYCPPMDYLDNQTEPNMRRTAFGPHDHVTDKGCLPFLVPIKGGPWNYTYHPEKIPPRLQEGCVPFTRQNATIEVDPANGWVSLNFVAAATTVQFVVSLNEHELWLYKMNSHYVQPRLFIAAVMSAGETFSVLVKLDKPPGTYTLRILNSGGTQVISAFTNVVYKGSGSRTTSAAVLASSPWLSYGGLPLLEEVHNRMFAPWEGDNVIAPWSLTAPYAGPADEEYLLHLYPPDFQAASPLLFIPNAVLGTEDENLVIHTRNGSWVDLILKVSTLPGDKAAFMYFMHKHGSRTWRIKQGPGRWNYSSVTAARIKRPDSFNLGGGYWSVLRYRVDNPGPWLFHCHFKLHVMGGMALAILDGVNAWPELLDALFTILVNNGLLKQRNNSTKNPQFLRTAALLPRSPAATLHERILHNHPRHANTRRLLHLTVPMLANCLRGTANPIRLLFSTSAGRDLLQDFYANTPIFITASHQLAELFQRVFSPLQNHTHNPSQPFKILKVSAGFGGITGFILNALVAARIPF